jgi:hypothetical protein
LAGATKETTSHQPFLGKNSSQISNPLAVRICLLLGFSTADARTGIELSLLLLSWDVL